MKKPRQCNESPQNKHLPLLTSLHKLKCLNPKISLRQKDKIVTGRSKGIDRKLKLTLLWEMEIHQSLPPLYAGENAD